MKKPGIPFLIVALIFSLAAAAFPSHAKAAPTAEITKIVGAKGEIKASGLDQGKPVDVYDDNNVVLGTETVLGDGTAVIGFTFPNSEGTLTVVAMVNGVETEVAALVYKDIDFSPKAALTTINGDQGTVTVSNASPGQTVRVYSDANVQLAEKTVSSDREAVLTFTFPTADGELSVRTVNNGTETEIAVFPYSGVGLPSSPSPAAIISDIDGANGTVTATNVNAGQTVRVYSDANVQLAEETANANGTAILTFTFPTSNGELSVRTVSNGAETEIATLPYSGIVISDPDPTPTADLTDINGAQGTVTVSQASPGQTVRVYSDGNVKLAEKEADSSGAASLTFTFVTSDGDLSVRLVNNGTETEIVKLPYSGVDIPSSPSPAAIISNIDGASGTVTATNVNAGQTVRVYSDANVQLAEETANANGTAVLTFTFPTSNGELSVRTVSNGTETEIATLPYSGVDIPSSPSPAAIISNIDGANGTVTATNVNAGQTVRVYSDANVQLAEETANANGTAVLTFTFPTSNGELSVRTVSNGTETEIATLPYSGVDIPSSPSPAAIISDISGASGTVTATNVNAGQTVRVYSDANVQLAEETANANGTAVLTFTFPTSNGELSVRTVSNGTETEIATLPYSGVVIPSPNPTPVEPVPTTPIPNPPATVPNIANPASPNVSPSAPVVVPPIILPPAIPQTNDPQPVRVSLTVQAVPNFSDTSGHWAQKEIQRLQSLGVFTGIDDGRFVPEEALTRAQFVQMIGNLLKLDPSSAPYRFSDVPDDAWYLDAVRAADAAGIVAGYANGSFKPDRLISREEMTQMIVNAIRYLNTNAQLPANGQQTLETFRDASSVGGWARENMTLAVNAGLVQGKPGSTLSPKAGATRAEAASMLSRLIDRMNDHFTIN